VRGVNLVAWFRVLDAVKMVARRVIMLIHDMGLV